MHPFSCDNKQEKGREKKLTQNNEFKFKVGDGTRSRSPNITVHLSHLFFSFLPLVSLLKKKNEICSRDFNNFFFPLSQQQTRPQAIFFSLQVGHIRLDPKVL